MDKKVIKDISNELEAHAGGIADKMINFQKETGETQFIVRAHKKNGHIALLSAIDKKPLEILSKKRLNIQDEGDYIDLAFINLPKNPELSNLKDMSDCIISAIFDVTREELDILSENEEHEAEIYKIPKAIPKKKNKSLKDAKLYNLDDLFFTLPISEGVSRVLFACNLDIKYFVDQSVSSDFLVISGNNDGVFEAEIIDCQIAMSPTFKRDEKIIINTKDKKIEDGSIYACYLSCIDKPYIDVEIRRVFKKADKIVLNADNPSLDRDYTKSHNDILIKEKDIKNVIIGKIIKKKSFKEELSV